MSETIRPRFANRLAREKSPYLRQHAHNPVDWYPWGEEAFAKAGAEQKPIFLSVGYSTCHWCHVMAHESFEDERIAEALNRDFVPVKVDREERPDIDRVYMTYVQAATGQGGWPMSVWLTPELKPFFGGTYFPPEDRWGRPGFGALLRALAQAWARDREQVLAESIRVTEAIRAYARGAGSPGEGRSSLADPAVLGGSPGARARMQGGEARDGGLILAMEKASERCFQDLAGSFDAEWGGFGGAPKFPRAAVFNFLFRIAAGATSRPWPADRPDRENPDDSARSEGADSPWPPARIADAARHMAAQTLRKMAEGGIHDHVGGGFHRYSVDEQWFVPHFEKMLYDQAQLAVSYLEARQGTGDERFAWVARGIFDYVLRDLAHPGGGFYSAEDADSEMPESETGDRRRAEGAFYLWTKEEIGRVLEDGGSSPTRATGAPPPQSPADLFCAHFDVEASGNVAGGRDPSGEFRGKNILRQRRPLADTARQFGLDLAAASDRLQAGLNRLREARARRPRPHLDDKIITAWNGLMVSALARGHQILGEAERSRVDYLAAAIRTAEFLRRELYDETAGILYRSYCDGRGNVPGFAEDYAYLVQGLIDLYEAAFDIRWLQWAGQLQARMDELFWDADHGGYFNSRAGDRSIIAQLKENYDGAEPAPSSVAALNLLRLEAMIGGGADSNSSGLGRADRALRCLAAFRGQWQAAPSSLPQMLGALEFIQRPPRTVVIAGDPRGDDFRALAAVLHENPGPRPVLLAADQAEGQAWLAGRRAYLAEMKPIDGRAAAYVCENFACQQPVTDPADLRRIVTRPPPP